MFDENNQGTEDIFEATEPLDSPKPGGPTPPAKPAAPPARPALPAASPSAPVRAATAPQPVLRAVPRTPTPIIGDSEEPSKLITSKAVIVLLSALILIGVFIWVLRLLVMKTIPGGPVTNTNTPAVNVPVTVPNIPGPSDAASNNGAVNVPTTQPLPPPDTDHDGLTDEEEMRLGTNPSSPDTDNDGLTDFDEVKVYHSNPLNPDTDGDGFKDGDEVKKGFDPNKGGGAKLFDLQSGIKNLNAK
ncbi:hypothetical protein HY224_03465 [Candidatus Uhrbacteria bacterium]|nr:hypothetical protein [Candidatus Uhrbacteria bacterium]